MSAASEVGTDPEFDAFKPFEGELPFSLRSLRGLGRRLTRICTQA